MTTNNKKTTKKIVKKPDTKKSVTKAKKNIMKSRVKTTAKPKSQARKAKANSVKAKSVRLPDNVDPSAIERVETIKQGLDDYIKNHVFVVTYVSAFCFLLVGALFTVSELIETSPRTNNVAQTANLVNTTDAVEEPLLDFSNLSLIRDQVTEPHTINFIVEGSDQVTAQINNISTGDTSNIDVQPKGNSAYEIVINPDDYPAGFYDLTINPNSAIAQTTYRSKKFEIIKATDLSADETVRTIEEESESTTETDLVSISQAPNEEILTTRPSLTFEGDDTISDTVTLEMEAHNNLELVELYARPAQSSNSRFVTTGFYADNNWRFSFDSNNIPDGVYSFIAKFNLNQEPIQSSELRLVVDNKDSETAIDIETESDNNDVTEDDPSLANTESDPAIIEPEKNETPVVNIRQATETATSEPDRFSATDIISIQATDDANETSDTNEIEEMPNDESESASEKITTDLINVNQDRISELLKRYATAVQAGDETMIRLAEEELNEIREEILNETREDSELRLIASDIDKHLSKKLDTYKSRVKSFERIRQERTSGSSSLDTDGDGITDFDEVNVYQTDPNNPDTDNDGFNDGVEIMRGFDPHSDQAEASIKFESPRDFEALSRDDVLKVNEVNPVVEIAEDTESESVLTEIKGNGLPNSFVTLYIFSMPTVVTIKTDADGSFVYTFDKELEDGRHDVYVAVTDNTGSIIAQSNPFSFIKTAQAFSPVDDNETGITGSVNPSDNSPNSYGLVIGVAVIALGLILLMLGINIKPRNEEIIVTENEPNASV